MYLRSNYIYANFFLLFFIRFVSFLPASDECDDWEIFSCRPLAITPLYYSYVAVGENGLFPLYTLAEEERKVRRKAYMYISRERERDKAAVDYSRDWY